MNVGACARALALSYLAGSGCHAPPALHWIGGQHLPVSRWQRLPAAWLVTSWEARPGQRYRVQVQGVTGAYELCLRAGRIDPPEYDIEDAVPGDTSCPKPNPGAFAQASVEVPDGGNAVWVDLHPTGSGDRHFDLRLDPL